MNLNLNLNMSLLSPNTVIYGISAEYGDDYNRDFLSFHIGNNTATLDSLSGTTRLIDIQGDLEHLIESPIVVAYSTTQWQPGECVTDFIIRTQLGEVTFTWVGPSSQDLELK